MAKDKLKFTITDSRLGEFSFSSTLYKSRTKGLRPAVFITPILGGFDFIETCLARLFTYSGIHVFITDFMPKLDLYRQVADLNVHDKTYLKSVLGMEKLVKFCEGHPDIDADKLGLFGMSLGGIFTNIHSKINPRFKASVIIAGGGHHHEILALSKQPVMVLLKNLRKQQFHLESDEEYQKLMACHNEMDSLKIFCRSQSKSVLMFISTNDDQVPTSVQVETWNDLGRPSAVFLQVPHYKMITSVPFRYFKKIRDFYLEKFYPGITRGIKFNEAAF